MLIKKRAFWLSGSLLIIALVILSSYALWQSVLKQETTNVVTTGCLKISFVDNNPINLLNAYPITNEEGMAHAC